MATILVCDDEPAVRFTVEEALSSAGHEVIAVDGADAASARLGDCDAVLTDLVMPGRDGLSLLAEARALDADLPVVILTARGTERDAVSAMKAGAYDYLTKPFALDELRAVMARAVETRALRRSARQLAVERALGRALVGESPAFRALVDDARRVARREVTVLLRGETGTGKELIASLIHAESPRRDGPCVRFNCAAIPAEVAESELFGHARGAFTGAVAARKGYWAQADGGTLVLDEVGELPIALQPKLLRALQEGEIQPVGAARVERVSARVVASTHRDLRAEVDAGRFREDLYYRLAVVELTVPPLRARRDDIPRLIDHLRRRYAARFELPDARFSPELVDALRARPWPGNVRELENAVARILALSDGGALGLEALSRLDGDASAPAESPRRGLRDEVAGFERDLLQRALAECDGNQSEAARRLGLSRMTLLDKLKRHGLR
ncbi:MAG: sigma-54 dependent transcriptional regulator [Polyangiales bacterium]